MQFSWIFFALLSVACSVTYGLVSKKMLNDEDDHDPIAYASSLFLSVAIFSFISYIITGFDIKDISALTNKSALGLLAINLTVYTLAPSLYWRALKHLPASEVSILWDLTTLYIFILGITLGTESFSLVRLIGGLCIVGSAIALGIATQRKSNIKLNKYFWMLMISTVLYAFAALTDNAIISRDYFSPLFFQVLSFGIPSQLILLINPRSIKSLKKIYRTHVLKYVWLNGFFFFVSFWAIYKAYDIGGLTSEVNFVISSETVLTVVLASLLLKERDHMKLKILCGIIVSLGIYLLS